MKIKNLLPALGIMLVISGCTPISPGDADPSTAVEAQSGAATSTSTDNSGETVALSDSELMEFTTLFNTAEYNGFLVNGFNSPEDIDWNAVISNGAGVATRNAGVAEINNYLEATGKKELDSESVLYVIKNSDLAKYIQKHTGTEVSPNPEDLSWDYLDEYDSYYFYTRYIPKNNFDCTCISGEKSGDTYTLRFAYYAATDDSGESTTKNNYGFYADRVLTLTKSGDDIVVKSNEIQWDDHSDPKLTKDVELPQFDTPIHVVTYNKEPYNACMALVKDGKSLIEYQESNQINLLWQTTFMDEPMEYTEVLDYDFFDYNADGLKDLAVIQNSDYGKYLRLFSASPDDFHVFAELDEEDISKFAPAFTLDSIKSVLLKDGNEEKKSDYKEAYKQIIHVYHTLYNFGELDHDIFDLKYDLIYADDDDIPELVIERYSSVSLYTYKNGVPICLMDSMLNDILEFDGSYHHCFYAPKKNIYYSMTGNQYDYTSSTVDKSYIQADENAELHFNFEVNEIKYNSPRPSTPEELESVRDTDGTAEYVNNTGKKMTEDEIKATVDLYDSYEKKEITGTMDYNAIMEKLNQQ